MSIDKTLLVLIHFDGNGDLLNDKELNDLRFSTLKKLLFEHASKEHGLLIVSDPIHNDRKVTYRLKNMLRQLKAQQNEINYTEWLEVPEKETDIKWNREYPKDGAIVWKKKDFTDGSWNNVGEIEWKSDSPLKYNKSAI